METKHRTAFILRLLHHVQVTPRRMDAAVATWLGRVQLVNRQIRAKFSDRRQRRRFVVADKLTDHVPQDRVLLVRGKARDVTGDLRTGEHAPPAPVKFFPGVLCPGDLLGGCRWQIVDRDALRVGIGPVVIVADPRDRDIVQREVRLKIAYTRIAEWHGLPFHGEFDKSGILLCQSLYLGD